MKNLTITITYLLVVAFGYSQAPCTNGKAGSYPCKDYDLMSHITLSEMSASAGNDSWGWTDPTNGKEYALIGLNNGTAFIDISDPVNPVYLGKLPTATYSSSWRDVKVYKNHAFIVSEASNHGMQVFDLTRLRNVSNPPQTFSADTRYTQFGNAHNIVINENTGYAYVVGAQRSSGAYKGGPLFINIQDPKNPKNAGGFLSDGQQAYTHDAQVVTYNGPDSNYTGKEILIGSNEIEVVIADITDKSNPVTISTINYSDVGYTHQGWFTEDMRYFILGDETDEQGVGFNTRTIIFDFQDLKNPKQHMTYSGPTSAIDHNGYVKGNKFYLANYRSGIRVIDIAAIGDKNISEIGFFDTYPSSNSAAFNGVWNVYPYFSSENIVISDIEGGFFLVRKSNTSTPCVASVPNGLMASGVNANSATINWNAISSATYDVRYRKTGTSSWTTKPSSNISYLITGLETLTSYEAQVRSNCTDGSSSEYSGSIAFTTTDIQIDYCDSNGLDGSDEYISKVVIGSISNSTGNSDGGYGDYTSLSTNLADNKTHIITITPTWTGSTYDEGYSVWIDFNRDGDFTGANEQVWTQSPTKNTPVSGDFKIPEGVTEGATRMRVSMKYKGVPSSCESFKYGEVEDYTVIITAEGGGGGEEEEDDECISGISSFPYNEGFENTLGDWKQSLEDDIDWIINSGETPSSNTGPSSAVEGTYYVYVEASGNGAGFPKKQAILNSPCFDLSEAESAIISFSYHMYGSSDIGSLDLEVSKDNGVTWASIWSQNTNKENEWIEEDVDLQEYVGGAIQLRFNRITGTTWKADVAIDNVIFSTRFFARNSQPTAENINFSIFPNPAEGNFINVFMKSNGYYKFEIKSILGQLVSKGNVTREIDVSNLKSGVYFMQIASEGKVISKRFVKK